MSIFNKIFGGRGNRPDPAPQRISEARKRGQTLLLELSTQLTVEYQRRCAAREEEREVIKEARKQGEKLEKTKYPINDESLEKYTADIAALHCGLANSTVQFLDSREIDQEITKLAGWMLRAVQKERATVAEDAFEGLCWAVTIGRSDIPETELNTMDDVITERLKIFEAYETCVRSADSAEDVQAKLHDEQAQMEIFRTDLEAIMDRLQHAAVDLEDLEEELELDPKYTGDSEDERLAIKIIIEEEHPIKQNIAELSKLIDQNVSLSLTYKHDRYTAKIAILAKTAKQYPDMSRKLDDLSQYIKSDAAHVTDIINNMIRSQNYFSEVCQSIQEGPEEKRRRIEAIREHLEEKQRKLRQEQKKKQKQEAAAAKQKEEAARLAAEARKNPEHKTVIEN